MRLIALDENRLERLLLILDPAIAELRRKGAIELATELLSLKKYIRATIQMAPTIASAAAEMGRIGGRSRSHRKLNAAKKNSAKAGRPGRYYARLIIEPIRDHFPGQAIHYVFGDRRSRDEWLHGPGSREPLYS
ncbi:MAG: hypothetical protein ACRDHZ_10435, partial [Ktedonobacteraceae bacterium]